MCVFVGTGMENDMRRCGKLGLLRRGQTSAERSQKDRVRKQAEASDGLRGPREPRHVGHP